MDLYRVFASEAFNLDYKKIGKDSTERFIAKCCIAKGTPVLCESGWKPIEQVSNTDKLWDGENWVCHQGLVDKGWKETVSIYGSLLTPNHQVWSGQEWLEAQQILANENILSQALAFAVGSLPSQGTSQECDGELKRSLFSVLVGDLNIQLTNIISNYLSPLDVGSAGQRQGMKDAFGNIVEQCQTSTIEGGYSEELMQRLTDVITQTIDHMVHMGAVELKCAMNGETIKLHSLSMCNRLKDGMTLNCNLIEQMLMEIMSPIIYGSYRHQQICTINAKLASLKQKSHVYDLSYAGPLNRFTILTGAGPLIVHNCSLSLIYGTGAEKLKNTIRIQSKGKTTVTQQEAERLKSLYREKNNYVADAWREGTDILQWIKDGEQHTAYEFLPVMGKTGIIKPNGLILPYPELTEEFTDKGSEWHYTVRRGRATMRDKVYGAKVFQRCLAPDTDVLTNNGWKPLIEVTLYDRLWDGEQWVPHEGVIVKGQAETIEFEGVEMTPTHMIYCESGAVEAQKADAESCKSYAIKGLIRWEDQRRI